MHSPSTKIGSDFQLTIIINEISIKMLPNRLTVLLLALFSVISIVVTYPSTKNSDMVTVAATVLAATASMAASATVTTTKSTARSQRSADDDYAEEPSEEYVEKMSDIFELPLNVNHRRKNLENCKNMLCMPHYLCINDQIITNGSELLESRLSLRIDGDPSNIVCNDMEMPCCADDAMANLHQPESQNGTNITTVVAVDEETIDKKIDEKNFDDQSDVDSGNNLQNSNRCGYRSTTNSNVQQQQTVTRILNGDEAYPNEFPWIVGLFVRLDNDNLRFIGGGSLIHRSVILTAAHLIRKIPVGNLIVRAGEHNILDPLNDGKRQERNVTQKIIHNDLYIEAFINDIALLVVDQPFQLTDVVNTICIPPQSVSNEDGAQCASGGWGKNMAGHRGQYQATLKKIILPIVSRSKCEKKLRQTRLGPFYNLHESLMCAGGGRRDTCRGDGGSPLFCEIPQDVGRFYQAGIVAAGIGCGSDAPGLYVNIAHFSNWIKHQLGYINLDLDVENILSYDLFD